VSFEDTGDLLPDGRIIPPQPRPCCHELSATA
jgi:hypothetical protein